MVLYSIIHVGIGINGRDGSREKDLVREFPSRVPTLQRAEICRCFSLRRGAADGWASLDTVEMIHKSNEVSWVIAEVTNVPLVEIETTYCVTYTFSSL